MEILGNENGGPSSLATTCSSWSPIFHLEMVHDAPYGILLPSLSQQVESLHRDLSNQVQLPQTENEICTDVNLCVRRISQAEGRIDLVCLASRLTAIGYSAFLRTVPGGGKGYECFSNLRHSFICLCKEEDTKGRQLLVDPLFREQFVIQPSVAWYNSLLSLIPDIYVGDQNRTRAIVRLLTQAMELAFAAEGLDTPPWRKYNALCGKWLLATGIDMHIGSRIAAQSQAERNWSEAGEESVSRKEPLQGIGHETHRRGPHLQQVQRIGAYAGIVPLQQTEQFRSNKGGIALLLQSQALPAEGEDSTRHMEQARDYPTPRRVHFVQPLRSASDLLRYLSHG